MKTIQQILKAISAKRYSDVYISEQTGIPTSTICRLRNGKHQATTYERHMKVVRLYERVSKQK